MDAPAITARGRALSFAELCAAIFVVVAHNAFHWLPNEVPILVVLAIVSCRMREGVWINRWYGRPTSWRRTLFVALLCAGLLLVKDLVTPDGGNVSSVVSQARSVPRVLMSVFFVWTFAAFGEEIGYRGYLLGRARDAFGPSRGGTAAALIVSSIAFGVGHFYKGPAGMVDSAISGLFLGGAYLLTRNLWACTLAHGTIDTIVIVYSFLGGT